MKKLFKFFIIFVITNTIFIKSLNAQPGFLDPTFGNNGLVSSNDIAGCHAVAIQNDGKILTAGEYSGFVVERYNQDGTRDVNFGNNGRAFIKFHGNSDAATGIAVDQNQNIIVSGFEVINSITNIKIIVLKLKPNGNLDSSFGDNGIVTQTIDKINYTSAMILQPDGKIIVSGQPGKNENDYFKTFLIRFNSDGNIDSSFGDNGKVITEFDEAVTSTAIALQSDGKIISGGTYGFYYLRNPPYYIARYNADGSVDQGFGQEGIAKYAFGLGEGGDEWANDLNAIAIQPDGKIICGGNEGDYINFSYDMGLVRFNNDGSLDYTYGTNGIVVISYPDHYSTINTLLMQTDGKLIAGGTAQDFEVGADPMLLMRFLENGELDPEFAVNGLQTTTNGNNSIACKAGCLDQQGKIILAGNSNSRFLTARYNSDNVLADNFKEVKAAQNNEAITITWQTLNESGTKSFTVERSMNASDYVGINTVAAKGVASIYNYTDKNPLDGISYYRIRENAVNGTNTFSPVVKVVFNDNGIISLYPNPAKNTVTVKGLNKNVTAIIKITDMQGREISSQNFTQSSSATLNIRALSQGSYFVQVAQEGKVVRLKIVKE
ncbi:MAG: T9SS type A sorting domain-containing protein [Chitinophagaceae bacterium]